MKKIFLLSGKERHARPQLVLSVLLSVLFLSCPLSGLFIPGKGLNVAEKRYHDNPQGCFTFFVLLPDKTYHTDSLKPLKDGSGDLKGGSAEMKELSMDTTPKHPLSNKNLNFVIW